MLCEIRLFPTFQRHLKAVIKKYPKSETEINAAIASLAYNPTQGRIYPGFDLPVRKMRIPLKEYNLGDSKGLRLIYIYLEVKRKVLPFVVYKKGEIKSETDVIRLIRARLKEVLDEIR